jgi:hypothetical protein
MAYRETRFGDDIYSFQTLHLIQQSVDVQPAEPKLNLIDIPGADGSVDMSELPRGRVVYKDRTITWVFALFPGDDWDSKHSEVSNALNGKRCTIHLYSDWDWYYEGRVVVKKYNVDRALRQITVEATCFPYKMRYAFSGGTFSTTTDLTEIRLSNEQLPVVPEFYASVETELTWNGAAVVLSPGIWYSNLLDIELPKGISTIGVRALSTPGTIRILYREGSL